MDDFSSVVLYQLFPQWDLPALQKILESLESDVHVDVQDGPGSGEVVVRIGKATGVLIPAEGPMPEEMAIASLGMADIPESDRKYLVNHGAHVQVLCDENHGVAPIEKMIFLVKIGMALCYEEGLALCIPASGNCLTGRKLNDLQAMNSKGPRAWGIDDSEAALVPYEQHTLWNSLRHEGQPAELLVGFVPAEIDGRTWFISAGHSLFGMPEIVYYDGDIHDFHSAREYFRYFFRRYFSNPGRMVAGESIQVSDTTVFALEPMPDKYHEFQASTGTLLVKLIESPLQEKDWN